MSDLGDYLDADAGLAALRDHVGGHLGDDPGHDLAHALRVALWTVRIGGDAIDRRRAIAAALLHDIVNVPKNDPARARASELCATEARRILPEYGFDTDAIDEIANAIRDHSFSRGAVPVSALGNALQDADRLEALGAIGIMRCVSCGTQMGATYFDAADPWAERRELDDMAYSVDHFFTKLLGLHRTFRTDAGRQEALRRTETLRSFLGALSHELGVPIPSDL